MITKELAVMSLRPGVQWTMNGGDVAGIIWNDESTEPLTEKQVADEMARMTAAQEAAAATAAQNAADAIAHAKSLGFTDAMISAMYPALVTVAP